MCGIVGASPLYWEYNFNGNIPLVDGIEVPQVVLKLLRLSKNRGQDGYGFSIVSPEKLTTTRSDSITSKEIQEALDNLPSKLLSVIGHARYPTSWKESGKDSMQPASSMEFKEVWEHWFSFAFNWNIANAPQIQERLERKWYTFQLDGLDTEVLKVMIIDLVKEWVTDLRDIVQKIMSEIDGSCNIALTNRKWDTIIAKDFNDFHPLYWAVKDGVFLFSSETKPLKWVGCKIYDLHELWAWEYVYVRGWVKEHWALDGETNPTPCVFEEIYFSDGWSNSRWESMNDIRYAMWRQLAREEINEVDKENSVVVGVPASSYYQTKGFAEELWISDLTAIIKNPDVNSTFKANKEDIPALVRKKYIFNPELIPYIEGKDVYLVDDSIVRGSTMYYLVEEFRKFYKPKSIHLRIPSPPVVSWCPYGVNMKSHEELLAPKYIQFYDNPTQEEIQEISEELGSDSLNYLSLGGLVQNSWDIEVTKNEVKWACMWCLLRKYPTPSWELLHGLKHN